MKKGFSLIEVVVAIALSSIIALLLYRSFMQTQRVSLALEVTVDNESDVLLCANRVYQDITGMCEVGTFAEKEGKKVPASDQCVIEQFSSEAVGERVFTFLTTNPLLVYGESKVRLVRVLYALNQKDDRWSLMRYESPELSFEECKRNIAENALPGYEILSDIASWSVLGKELDRKNTHERVYTDKTSWSDKKQADEKKRLLPDYIEIAGIVREKRRLREFSFTWLIPVVSSGTVVAQISTQKPIEASQEKPQEKLARPVPVPHAQRSPEQPKQVPGRPR